MHTICSDYTISITESFLIFISRFLTTSFIYIWVLVYKNKTLLLWSSISHSEHICPHKMYTTQIPMYTSLSPTSVYTHHTTCSHRSTRRAALLLTNRDNNLRLWTLGVTHSDKDTLKYWIEYGLGTTESEAKNYCNPDSIVNCNLLNPYK